jgi:hypothetical protein
VVIEKETDASSFAASFGAQVIGDHSGYASRRGFEIGAELENQLFTALTHGAS